MIFNDIFDFLKIEVGKFDIEMIEFDFNMNVDDVGLIMVF